MMTLTPEESKALEKILRTAAWNFIIKMQIRTLPVEPLKILDQKKWDVYTYDKLSSRLNKSVKYIKENYNDEGFAFYSSTEHNYIICYNDKVDTAVARWTLMHEISHIELDHINKKTPILTRVRGKKIALYEYAADGFTRRVLCPSIVIYKCRAFEIKDIMNLCGISYQAAVHRSNYIKILKKRNKWYSDPLEIEVEYLFSDFINSYNEKTNSGIS